MAKKQQQKRKAKVRQNRAKQSPHEGFMTVVNQRGGVGPFPAMVCAWTRYVEKIALTEAAAGTGAHYFWCLSSLFDPNNTGTGHQPMYFDHLCAATGPYTRYRALRSKVRIEFASAINDISTFGGYVSTVTTSPVSFFQTMEKPWVKRKTLGPLTGANNVAVLHFDIDHAQAMCVTKQHLLDDDYYSADYGSSPTRNCFLDTFVFGNTASGSGYMTIEIDTYSQFYGLAAAPTS